MNEGIVLTKIDDRGIAEVTLNRPERNNAYNGEMISELIKSFTSLYKNNSSKQSKHILSLTQYLQLSLHGEHKPSLST